MKGDMTPEVAEAVSKFIMRMRFNNVHFFGGEPLFNPSIVKQVLAQTHVATYQITTNGTLLTPDLFEWLKLHKVKVALSFDGTKEIQDKFRDNSYDEVMANLPYWKQLTQNVLCTWADTHTIYDQITHIRDLGFKGVFINLLHPFGYGYDEEDLRDMEATYRRIIKDHQQPPFFQIYDLGKAYQVGLGRVQGHKGVCGFVRIGLGIDVDGKLYVCHRGMELGEDFSIGDVWNGVDTYREKKVRAAGEKLPEKCKKCNIGCLPCPINSYRATGEFGAEPDDYWCESLKIRQKVAMELGPNLYPNITKKMQSAKINVKAKN